jgi:capsular polysaccharide biosynthesis protein
VFTNPEPIVKSAKIPDKLVEEIKTTCSDIAKTLEFKPEPETMAVNVAVEVEPKKKTTKKSSTKKIAIVGDGKPTSTVVASNLFAGLFD